MENNKFSDDILSVLNREISHLEAHDVREQLRAYINHLLLHDFGRLVQLLYRIDVDEKKLKDLLQSHPDTDAVILITDLMIQRQQEKIQLRSQGNNAGEIPEEDKW